LQAEAQGVDLDRSAVVHKFLDRLTVDPIGLSTAMKVSFDSQDASKAALIANAVSNAYVEDQLEAKFDATQKATQWLSGRIAELSRQSQAADAAVQQYKAEHNITQTAEGGSVVDQQIAAINSQLVLAKTDLAEKQANYDQLLGLERAGRATDAAQVVASPVIGALRGQEATLSNQIANLSSKYGPRHPKMLDLEAQKENLNAKIGEEVQRIVASVMNDVDVARAHVGSLQQSLQQVESQGASQNVAEVQLTALQSASTSARAMYEAFLGRLNQTQGQEGIQTPDARVISKAEVPQSPSFPKKALLIGVSLPAGLILGLMLAFVVERLDSGFKTAVQLERLLGVPVLSTIPDVASAHRAPIEIADLIIDKPMSAFTEAVRGLQLGLTLTNADKRPKVILVTSSVPSEGKTTLAVSLARMAARSGVRTIIVDGDLRRPKIAQAFSRRIANHGLIEVLTGRMPLDMCLSKDPRSPLVVLPCLQTPANPADMLASQAMQKLMENLERVFDLVIIDSAPVLLVNDTKILSRLADAVLFAVRWEKTPRDAVVNALRSLADVHAPVAGVALTRTDNRRFRYYSYGYQNYDSYSGYYKD
jgi:exopolysaccharide transport family protein